MRGADALVAGLKARGVETVFALSGNQIMPVFDALFESGIDLVHTRHEAATVYMAEANAQIGGRVGVALVTAGGGLGNASGALIAAQASDTPVVLLSGDSPVAGDGRGAFQEMDQAGMTQGLTKGSRRVLRADDVDEALNWAMELAESGRPGPVHLALPADVLSDRVSSVSGEFVRSSQGEAVAPDLRALEVAERPLVILGPALNATRARGLAREMARALDAPVVAMESPRGLRDPGLGRIREVAAMADHVVCLGKPVDFTLGFGAETHWPKARNWDVFLGDEAQIDVARRNLGARLNEAALCDPRLVAEALVRRGPAPEKRADWRKRVEDHCRARVDAPSVSGISPADLCWAVQGQLERSEDPVLVCDGGEFGQWAQACLSAPRRIINGVSGVIGGGLAYAMGARAASPQSQVFALMGDGTIGFHLAEFETAVRNDLPFVAVIGNDRRWNAEHLIQTRDFGAARRIGCDLSGARYDLAVEAMGGFGVHVTDAGGLDAALVAAIKSGRPACVNVEIVGQAAPEF